MVTGAAYGMVPVCRLRGYIYSFLLKDTVLWNYYQGFGIRGGILALRGSRKWM